MGFGCPVLHTAPLIDPSEILYAIDLEGTDISLSSQTTLVMTDAVTPDSLSSVSLWQTSSVAFRASLMAKLAAGTRLRGLVLSRTY
jgi:hypothetical protein